jgi:hypothetical protein
MLRENIIGCLLPCIRYRDPLACITLKCIHALHIELRVGEPIDDWHDVVHSYLFRCLMKLVPLGPTVLERISLHHKVHADECHRVTRKHECTFQDPTKGDAHAIQTHASSSASVTAWVGHLRSFGLSSHQQNASDKCDKLQINSFKTHTIIST